MTPLEACPLKPLPIWSSQARKVASAVRKAAQLTLLGSHTWEEMSQFSSVLSILGDRAEGF
jgi:hypothetical protein